MSWICKECGADSFKTIDYDKVVKEKDEISRWYKRISADHGLEKAEWQIDRIRLIESTKWLQRKVKKQAQAITRLEEKIKKFGQKPYEEE